MANPRTGFDCELAYNSATHASPTWLPVAQIGDVSNDMARQMASQFIRESLFEFNEPAGIMLPVSFPLLYNPGATEFDALRTMFLAAGASAKKEFYMGDGDVDTAGTQGVRMYAVIENFPLNQHLQAISMIDRMTLRPAYFEVSSARVDPDWYTVSA